MRCLRIHHAKHESWHFVLDLMRIVGLAHELRRHGKPAPTRAKRVRP